MKTTLYTFWILKVTLRDRANDPPSGGSEHVLRRMNTSDNQINAILPNKGSPALPSTADTKKNNRKLALNNARLAGVNDIEVIALVNNKVRVLGGNGPQVQPDTASVGSGRRSTVLRKVSIPNGAKFGLKSDTENKSSGQTLRRLLFWKKKSNKDRVKV